MINTKYNQHVHHDPHCLIRGTPSELGDQVNYKGLILNLQFSRRCHCKFCRLRNAHPKYPFSLVIFEFEVENH